MNLLEVPLDNLGLILEHLRTHRDVLHFQGVCHIYRNFIKRILADRIYLNSWLCRFCPVYISDPTQPIESLQAFYILHSLSEDSSAKHVVAKCTQIYPELLNTEFRSCCMYTSTIKRRLFLNLELENQENAKVNWLSIGTTNCLYILFLREVAEVCVRKNLTVFAEFACHILNAKLCSQAILQGNLKFYRQPFLIISSARVEIAKALAETSFENVFQEECLSCMSRLSIDMKDKYFLSDIYQYLVQANNPARLEKLLIAKSHLADGHKYILKAVTYCTPTSECLPLLVKYYRPIYIKHLQQMSKVLRRIGASHLIKTIGVPSHMC